jgi:hypothetical protein
MIMNSSGSTKELHGEERHEMYSKSSIIRTTTPRRMRVAGQVARIGGKISIRHLLKDRKERTARKI